MSGDLLRGVEDSRSRLERAARESLSVDNVAVGTRTRQLAWRARKVSFSAVGS